LHIIKTVQKFKYIILSLFLTVCLSACADFYDLLTLDGSRDLDIPTGLYLGRFEEEGLNGDLAITIFPPDENSSSGVGLLNKENRSQRFYWKANGDNEKQIWNLQFRKDNNIYTHITEGFTFTGTLTVTDTERQLFGTLVLRDLANGTEKESFLSTFQYIEPEIVLAKEAPSAKPAEQIVLECRHCGINGNALSIKATNNIDHKNTEIKIERIEKSLPGEVKKLIVLIPSDLQKGEYSGYILRDEKYESNSFIFNVL
jgi:hypothetical protein